MRRFILMRGIEQMGQGVLLDDGRAFATVAGDRYDLPGMARVDLDVFASAGLGIEFIDKPTPVPCPECKGAGGLSDSGGDYSQGTGWLSVQTCPACEGTKVLGGRMVVR